MTESVLLEVNDLTTQFSTRRGTVTAVDGVSFDVAAGEVVALVGESGSGKSVTALSLMRLIDPSVGRVTNGSVSFGGRDLLALSPRKLREVRGNDIAMVFQDPMTTLNPVIKVGAQVAESLLLHHRADSRKAARAAAVDLLEMVGIASPAARAKAYPHELSGGMRQRIVIAIALACSPKLLIADEPTTALDVTVQSGIIDLIQRLRRELGMAVLLISHDLGVVAGIADRVNVMYAGRIVESGPVKDLFKRNRHPYTQGLLASVPRMVATAEPLRPIRGTPPQLSQLPPGCPFEPRCDHATERCGSDRPILDRIAEGHSVACWVRPEAPMRSAA
jgi:oligopeptide/dipeptide ABC transporter ATP-binding protein